MVDTVIFFSRPKIAAIALVHAAMGIFVLFAALSGVPSLTRIGLIVISVAMLASSLRLVELLMRRVFLELNTPYVQFTEIGLIRSRQLVFNMNDVKYVAYEGTMLTYLFPLSLAKLCEFKVQTRTGLHRILILSLFLQPGDHMKIKERVLAINMQLGAH